MYRPHSSQMGHASAMASRTDRYAPYNFTSVVPRSSSNTIEQYPAISVPAVANVQINNYLGMEKNKALPKKKAPAAKRAQPKKKTPAASKGTPAKPRGRPPSSDKLVTTTKTVTEKKAGNKIIKEVKTTTTTTTKVTQAEKPPVKKAAVKKKQATPKKKVQKGAVGKVAVKQEENRVQMLQLMQTQIMRGMYMNMKWRPDDLLNLISC